MKEGVKLTGKMAHSTLLLTLWWAVLNVTAEWMAQCVRNGQKGINTSLTQKIWVSVIGEKSRRYIKVMYAYLERGFFHECGLDRYYRKVFSKNV